MQITDKRLEVIDFAGPYAKTPGSFAALKGSPLSGFKGSLETVTLNEINAEEQKLIDDIKALLKGKVIGVQTTTTHSNFLDTYFKDISDIRKYDTQENVLLDLSAGRMDAAEASLSYWIPIMKTDQGKNLVLFGPAWNGDIFGLGNGIGVRKEDQDLKALLDKGVRQIHQDGTLKKLAEKWFGFDNTPK
jgi:octopine/nopaline transport system substrate-binding protein